MRVFLLAAIGLIAAESRGASVDPALPRYAPQRFEVASSASYVTADGAITVVGYNDMRDMLEALVERFSALHRGVRIKLDLPGTRFAPEALANGESAFAPMGAQFTPSQLAAYRARTGNNPMMFRVAHASLDPKALSGPLAVIVHRDNPIASLTLDQIAHVFTGDVRQWGELGMQGNWNTRAVPTYGMQHGTALAFEMQQAALQGRAFSGQMVGFAQSADVARSVAVDPSSIGFGAAIRATPEVRVIPIAAHSGDVPVAPTEENIIAGRYPLDRYLLVYTSQPPAPVAREFLRLMLSLEGQEAIAASPQRYLPLSAGEAAAQRSRLE
jgi:phosphate transport system substrate-binding protein